MLNLTFWKLREITLLIFLQGMLSLKGPTTAKPLSLSTGIFPQMILSKNLAIEDPTVDSVKEKTRLEIWQFFGKKRKVWFISNNSVLSETLKNPLLITYTKPMVYWQWINIVRETLTKLQKVPTSIVLVIQSTPHGRLRTASRYFKVPNGPFKV